MSPATSISENSEVTIPIRNLVSIVFAVAVAVAGYARINATLLRIQHQIAIVEKDVEANFQWRENWEKSGMLPTDIIQNEKIASMQKELDDLRAKVKINH